jgi:hypothetical protein
MDVVGLLWMDWKIIGQCIGKVQPVKPSQSQYSPTLRTLVFLYNQKHKLRKYRFVVAPCPSVDKRDRPSCVCKLTLIGVSLLPKVSVMIHSLRSFTFQINSKAIATGL